VASPVIAIDGPAGSGKSTTARAVARALDMGHLDSGALYRALTLVMLDHDLPMDGTRILAAAESLPVRLVWRDGAFVPEVAGVDVSHAVRSKRVTERVSAVSAIPVVREWVTTRLRGAAGLHPRGVVSDGRDIGTVVFPDALLKVYLTASAEERARRRARDDGLDPDGPEGRRLVADLTARDHADTGRSVAPLVQASDAILLDTTDLSFDQQVDEIARLARKAFK
jgi:CMP/dCMP kinase